MKFYGIYLSHSGFFHSIIPFRLLPDMTQSVNITELNLPQLEMLKNQLDQEVEFLSTSIAQLKVVQTKYFLTKQMEKIQPALQEKHAMKQAVMEMMSQKRFRNWPSAPAAGAGTLWAWLPGAQDGRGLLRANKCACGAQKKKKKIPFRSIYLSQMARSYSF
uniref:Prefoldin subunit 5 n=1 Tax=Canis lupus familiaris TaxID=9615 RepID=A0A8I3MRR0_CANLF